MQYHYVNVPIRIKMYLHDPGQLLLKEGSSGFLTIIKLLTIEYPVVALTTNYEFAINANNPSTKRAESAPVWFAQVAIAIADSHLYRALTFSVWQRAAGQSKNDLDADKSSLSAVIGREFKYALI